MAFGSVLQFKRSDEPWRERESGEQKTQVGMKRILEVATDF
jgi:hypothetical protein